MVPGLAVFAADPAPAPVIPLVRDGRSTCVIVHSSAEPLMARTARRLADYLREQTEADVAVIPDVPAATIPSGVSVVVLDGSPDQRVIARFSRPEDIASDRVDAYRLRALVPPTGPALVLAAGRSAAGVKYAAYRLMQGLEIKDRSAGLRALDVMAAPLLRVRPVSLFNVWSMPIALTRRHNTESWSPEALDRYVDMYDAFGFNAIESHDRFDDNYLEALFGLTRADWREKVWRMCDRAHDNGQQFFLRIWGHNVMATPKSTRPPGATSAVPRRITSLCVNDPVERRRWEEEILGYYVGHYAGRIDHLIGHWCDPGGCRRNGCDFRTPLRLQMELHQAFRRVDPRFSSTFSLWYFERITRSGGWAGYTSPLELVRSGILAPDVGIAVGSTRSGPYSEEVVQAIQAAGHAPAVWTWYRADNEIRPSLHIHLHERLGDYFRGLPDSSRQLAWHNVERNVHGAANTANYYVAGRLMWEPNLEVDGLLRQFLNLVFGETVAPRVLPAYLAIARIRCHSCHRNGGGSRLTGVGTSDAGADLRLAREALAQLDSAMLDPRFRPRIPLDVTPVQIIADLRASLEVIQDYARCRAEDMPAVRRDVAERDFGSAARRLEALSRSFGGWNATLAGRQEWSLLDAFIREQRQQLVSAPARPEGNR